MYFFFQMADWDADDPAQPKIFTLAGFNSAPAEKADLVAKITSLGGSVVEGSSWKGECSHVIAANFGQYLEKVMAGLVAGRWVVTKRFVERSYQKGAWANTKAFVCDESVLNHRRRWFEKGGIFKDMKVVLLLENAVKSGVYSRIVEAGGGEVQHDWSLSDLLNNQPCSSDLTCVVVDPGIQLAGDQRHHQWVKWLEVVRDTWPADSSLPHVYYKYIFSIITQCKTLSAEQFSIFSPAVLEMAKRDGNMPQGWSGVAKRSADGSDVQVDNKRLKVGQATKIVTTVVESNVVTLDDSDSDDDIEILEQKITQRKAGANSRRTYYEKPQSFTRNRSKEAKVVDAEIVDLGDSDNESKDANYTKSKDIIEVSMEVDQDAPDQLSEGDESNNETASNMQVLETESEVKSEESSNPVKHAAGNKTSRGISVGLQHAISALQQTSRGPVRLTKSKKESTKNNPKIGPVDPAINTSAEENSTDDDIEIISSKAGIKVKKQRRAAPKLDARAKMFQARLKDLLEAETTVSTSISDLPSDDPPERSPSPEIHKVTEPEEIPMPTLPVAPFVAEASEKSTQLLHKVLSCILERQTLTDECIAVSNTNCRTARFDKNKESGSLVEVKVKPVDSTVKEEFYQKYLEKTSQKESETYVVGLSGQINQISNCLSSLRYLRCSTSFTCHPTPAILNSLMMDYILEQSSPMVRISAYNYLDQFMFLHLGRETEDRPAWLKLILSACRTGSNLQWDSFSVESRQDIAQCWRFFCLVIQQYQAQCKDGSCNDCQSGPELLLQLLVKLLRKDLELWWKHFRRSDGKDGRVLSFPLLYYMLDGSTSLVHNMNTSVVRLYRAALASDNDVTVVRHLVSMCALLLAHMDSQVRQSFIFSGAKVEFAVNLETALSQCIAARQDSSWLFTELSLLQPPWLAMLVARRLIMTQPSKARLNTVSDLTCKLSQLTVSSCPVLAVAADCLAHRMVSSCHLHTLLRTHWLHSCCMQEQGSCWKMMERLDKAGVRTQPSSKVVRFRSGVTFKTSTIVDDLNMLADFVNGVKSVDGDVGAISALLFKMTSPTCF